MKIHHRTWSGQKFLSRSIRKERKKVLVIKSQKKWNLIFFWLIVLKKWNWIWWERSSKEQSAFDRGHVKNGTNSSPLKIDIECLWIPQFMLIESESSSRGLRLCEHKVFLLFCARGNLGRLAWFHFRRKRRDPFWWPRNHSTHSATW